ncbi:hypothetical protein PPERSA_00206 [Pseudocohnilembus persalinus]|uniref:Uncharacterized protein n=1 Tax=Pseudocohnilembus persalinus TaxID=266149 RepID=A0A0V0QR45_PSEPJ|nr:hypothetical protein PPERSA_00206 [Pseudocohnilembus persalinus]|eukprot:KRX04437.1 hypothetical protein PPERSA_00206 [Pseudocohnilembus persalinus]
MMKYSVQIDNDGQNLGKNSEQFKQKNKFNIFSDITCQQDQLCLDKQNGLYKKKQSKVMDWIDQFEYLYLNQFQENFQQQQFQQQEKQISGKIENLGEMKCSQKLSVPCVWGKYNLKKENQGNEEVICEFQSPVQNTQLNSQLDYLNDNQILKHQDQLLKYKEMRKNFSNLKTEKKIYFHSDQFRINGQQQQEQVQSSQLSPQKQQNYQIQQDIKKEENQEYKKMLRNFIEKSNESLGLLNTIAQNMQKNYLANNQDEQYRIDNYINISNFEESCQENLEGQNINKQCQDINSEINRKKIQNKNDNEYEEEAKKLESKQIQLEQDQSQQINQENFQYYTFSQIEIDKEKVNLDKSLDSYGDIQI